MMTPKSLLKELAKWGLENGFDLAEELVDAFSAARPDLITPTKPGAPPTGTQDRLDEEAREKIERGEW